MPAVHPTLRTVLAAATFAAVSAAGGLSAAAEPVRSGAFSGVSGHSAAGTASIVRTADGYAVELGKDFSLDGAPDPKVALGRSGYRSETLLGPLKTLRGAQTYVLPANLDPEKYDEVWIWCEEFNVGLGLAKIR